MHWLTVLLELEVALEYVLKIIAIGTVPENRRPSSSQAWLLLILVLPVVGFPLYWVIGSPYVRGRRATVQRYATEVIEDHAARLPPTPLHARPSAALSGVLTMNRNLTGLPCVTGLTRGTFDVTAELYADMAATVDEAVLFVHLEVYIMAWDDTTDVLFTALANARRRGVTVRLLLDHLGSRKYPGWKQFQRRLTDADIDWHLMMPLLPLHGRWRRPDLRNHRKLLVVDGRVAYLGSHNLIDPTYDSAKNARAGRHWQDLSLKVGGAIVGQVEAVFATDWYAETGELLAAAFHVAPAEDLVLGGSANALQLVPSGPGFPTEPNRNQFVQLIHQATRKVTITSPYFVPDESLLTAIIGAAYRGVRVELFVSEKADQFLVGHAQRSYYHALLEAGVHIFLYPQPMVLHAKYFTIDDEVGVIGSSNMDFRSFALNYEIMLLGFGGDLVATLHESDRRYRAVCRELTLEEWARQSWRSRYVDNVCRLTSALM
ncbi:phospholipase D-like domain-containing protein [Nocardioides ultimimeridianus]